MLACSVCGMILEIPMGNLKKMRLRKNGGREKIEYYSALSGQSLWWWGTLKDNTSKVQERGRLSIN